MMPIPYLVDIYAILAYSRLELVILTINFTNN